MIDPLGESMRLPAHGYKPVARFVFPAQVRLPRGLFSPNRIKLCVNLKT